MTTAISIGAALVAVACAVMTYVWKGEAARSANAAEHAANEAFRDAEHTFNLTKSLKRQQ